MSGVSMIEEPPDSWQAWAEIVGIASIGFAFGVLVGYVRAPRAQRKVVNEYVMERISGRTRTVLAILKVSTGYWDDEIEEELKDRGDLVQEATVIPVDKDGRLCAPELHGPPILPHHPAAF